MRLGAIHCTKVTKKIGFSKSNFSNYVLFVATLCLTHIAAAFGEKLKDS